MTTFPLYVLLNLCSGFVPGDGEMTMYLCASQFEAKHRQVMKPYKFDYKKFLIQASKVHCVRIIDNGHTCVKEE